MFLILLPKVKGNLYTSLALICLVSPIQMLRNSSRYTSKFLSNINFFPSFGVAIVSISAVLCAISA